jgi:ADP-ribose pyrophosphatase YjhB (NUDIX family)
VKDKFGTARPYAASYVILRKGTKIALVLRGNLPFMPHHYGLPAGKSEIGESFLEAAIREAKEEVGITVRPDQLRHVLSVHRFAHDDEPMEWVDTIFEATAWEGEPYNAEPHMHDEVSWFEIDALPENTIPAIKEYLKAIAIGMQYLEYGWPSR